MNTRILLVSLLMLLLIAAAGYYRFSPPPLAQVPDITLVSVDGEELQLPAYRGKPLLVTFWSTTCPACVKEIPHLIDLYRELAPRGGLEIIGIAMAHDPPDRVPWRCANRAAYHTRSRSISTAMPRTPSAMSG